MLSFSLNVLLFRAKLISVYVDIILSEEGVSASFKNVFIQLKVTKSEEKKLERLFFSFLGVEVGSSGTCNEWYQHVNRNYLLS